jgi:hypothetical protein
LQIVPAVPVKSAGMFVASKYPTADAAARWQPLYEAANAYAMADQAAKREAALADAAVEVANSKAARKAKAEAIAARLNTEATMEKQLAAVGNPMTVIIEPGDDETIDSIDAMNAEAIDNGANPFVAPAAVRAMFKGLGWSTTDPAPADIDVVEPIVSMTADGQPQTPEGLRRPIVKATREAMAACAAVGLAYWSDHPKPSHVWAVDADQQPHPVRIDRKRKLAVIAEPNDAIGGNPLVSWSVDADMTATLDALAAGESVTIGEATDDDDTAPQNVVDVETADAIASAELAQQVAAGEVSFTDAVMGALADEGRLIVGHIGDPVPGIVAPSYVGGQESVAIDQRPAEPGATDTPALGVNARKALLAGMVRDALNKMVGELNNADLAALGMADGDAVTAQLKMWLRRSGRAMIYGDGKGVADAD